MKLLKRADFGKSFRALRTRNFRLFFIGQFISQVGNWLTLVAQTLLVFHVTHSGVAVGMLVAFQFGPVLLLGPYAGLIADRSDKRKLLLIVQALAMVQSFALAAIASMNQPSLVLINLVALVGGVTVAFDNPARRAFVTEMVQEKDINNAVSLNSALMTGSRVVGPTLAGLLAHNFGYAWCFAIDGASYVGVLIALWMMRPSELRPAVAAPRGKRQIREGFRYVRSIPDLFVPLVMMLIIGVFAFNFQVTMPLLTERTFGGNDATFTLLFSMISAGSFIGALAVARRTSVDIRHVVIAATAFGITMIALGLAPTFRWSLGIGFAMGLASIGFMTSCTTLVQVVAAPEMRGRVLALQAMVFLGSTPIGGPLIGWIGQHYGARPSVVLGGVACLVAALWGYYADRDARIYANTAA